jgi:hypothetical protein
MSKRGNDCGGNAHDRAKQKTASNPAPAAEPVPPTEEKERSEPSNIRRILTHPITPILLGALVTLSGSGAFMLRCVGLVLVAGWAIYDVAVYFRGYKPSVPIVRISSLTVILLLGGSIFWCRNGLLNDIQANINIDATVPENGDAKDSKITVYNGSDVVINSYRPDCNIIRLLSTYTLLGQDFWRRDWNFTHP